MEKCNFEAKFCRRGVRVFFDPGWVSLREIRFMLCGGHIQRVYAATSLPPPCP
jgi:hypothetical protein